MESETIGFLGLGFMGHGMARNILKAGYKLTVTAHRNRAPIDDLVANGATEVKDARAVGEASTIVFLCVTGAAEVEALVRGPDGLVAGLKPGAVIVDTSTTDPNSTLALAAELKTLGIHYADAPLGGTPVQAAAGQLSAMVGADETVFQRIEPVIASWASKIVRIGGVGDGHKMKLINNFLSLGYGAIYAEALTLAQKVGISPQTFDSAIRGGRMDNGFYQTFMGYTLDGNREAHKFTLSNALKDLTYLASMAGAAKVANPVGAAVRNSYALAMGLGGTGPEDYVPHLPEYVGRANGVDMTPDKLKR